MRRRRYGAAVALGILATAGVFAANSTPAGADGQATATLDKAAWFDETYPTTTPVAPPAPAGVTAGELYVAGATVPVASTVPVTLPTQLYSSGLGTARQVLAFAALSFTIPAGSSPESLTLTLASGLQSSTLDAKLPFGVTLEACPTTSDFAAGPQQPVDKAPTYDCAGKTSIADISADGTSIDFSDIGRIASGKTLSFVVLPYTTGVDRLAFTAPTAESLSLLDFDSAPTFNSGGVPVTAAAVPPVATPGSRAARGSTRPVGSTPGVARPAPVSAVAAPAAPAAAAVPSPSAGGPGSAAGSTAAPVPAGNGTGASDTTSATGSAAAPALAAATKPVDDTRTRLLALSGLTILLSTVGLLAYTDKRRETDAGVWGHGRFRRARNGQAPRI